MKFITDENELMIAANLDCNMGFDCIGFQSDGQPVVFDRCGGFGYLDQNIYNVVISI